MEQMTIGAEWVLPTMEVSVVYDESDPRASASGVPKEKRRRGNAGSAKTPEKHKITVRW